MSDRPIVTPDHHVKLRIGSYTSQHVPMRTWRAWHGVYRDALPCGWSRSPDAEFILDGDEFNLEWRYAEAPSRLVPSTRGLPLVDEWHRNTPIIEWVMKKHNDDWLAALRESPLIVLLAIEEDDAGKLFQATYLLDGWHRLKLARRWSNITHIPVILAREYEVDANGRYSGDIVIKEEKPDETHRRPADHDPGQSA